MSLDLLSCMRGFKAIAEHKGFSQAARYSHVSTSTLTGQIKHLEALLKRKLLNRTTRHIELTEAGEIYLTHVKKILSDIDGAEKAVNAVEIVPHGRLIIGISGAFYSQFFIDRFHEFLLKFPKMQLQTTEENAPTDILNGLTDLVITEIDIKDSQLVKEYLFTIHRSIYATPSYIKKYGSPKKAADLHHHNCLIAKRISPNNEWMLANNKKIYVSGNYASTSGYNVLCAALSGMGLIWCTDILIKEEINQGKLVEVKLKDEQPVAIKMFLYHRRVSSDSNISLMADYLKKVSGMWSS
jgi:DNA-binding transcriptional LysR family regulator